jgi:hypothetical protein
MADGDLYFFNPAAVGIQDGEFKIFERDDIVDFWDVAGNFQDQPGEGIAFSFHLVEGIDGMFIVLHTSFSIVRPSKI